ncbi:hypothetical protein ACTJK5_09680 [Agrobacterium sp. 22094]|uniref:hypothetical protein n=1 Tax=Agrobacterium sp. 22094 TaxID=3453872 RepID=UPI003F82A46B
MTARVFRSAARIFNRTFSEDSPARWYRHDGPAAGDPLSITFNSAYVERAVDGLEVTAPQPRATCLVMDAIAIAPERAQNLNMLFSNRDFLLIEGIRHDVESCSVDGYGSSTIKLIRKSADT